ncbi:hypothetical protein Tco_0870285 [Tanacetum coccineum]
MTLLPKGKLEDLDDKVDCGLLSEFGFNKKGEVLKCLFELEEENISSLKQMARYDGIFLDEWSKQNVLNLIRILRCF